MLDYGPIETEIRRLLDSFSIVEFTYDPYQLHSMAMDFRREGLVKTFEFKQNEPRLKADKQLRDFIIAKRIAHDGNPVLTEHIDNANVVNHGEDGIRIVKRSAHLKVDSVIATSQGVARCMYYNF